MEGCKKKKKEMAKKKNHKNYIKRLMESTSDSHFFSEMKCKCMQGGTQSLYSVVNMNILSSNTPEFKCSQRRR